MVKVSVIEKKVSENVLESVFINKVEQQIFSVFPTTIRNLFSEISRDLLIELEEIRFRLNRPLILITAKEHLTITPKKQLSKILENGYIVTHQDMEKILHKISQSSIYAWEEEFRRGYITLKGGHRIGLTGKAVLDKGLIKTLKDISGLNFRIAKEIIGVADQIMPYLITREQRIRHTLLVSPPRCGKTTLLRDIVRQLSTGIPSIGFLGVNVGLVDERSEIAGTFQGVPQYNVGLRTDVLDGCPKAQGMVMLVRSMSPQVIATDEIGTYEDIQALEEVLNAGVSLITTVHGHNLQDLKQRPYLSKIVEQRLFSRIIILGRSLGVGTIEQILDGDTFEPLLAKPRKGG